MPAPVRSPASQPAEALLPYAEPGVRTAPRRTLVRVLGRWLWNGVRWITRLIQVLLLGIGYVFLAAAVVTQFLLLGVASALLLAGRLRWNGHAVRVWSVRALNRVRLFLARPLRRRRAEVPLAAAHVTGSNT